MRWFPVLSLAAILLTNLASPASAEETIEPLPASPPFAAPAEEPERTWYGAPMLAVDGAAVVGTVGLALARPDPSTSRMLLYGLTAVYLLDGPVVHVLHGRLGRSAGSLLLRAGTVAAGVAVALSVMEGSGCFNDSFPKAVTCDAAPYGMLLSPVIAMLVDDLWLARDPAASQPPSRTISSRVVVQPGLAMFGVGGTF